MFPSPKVPETEDGESKLPFLSKQIKKQSYSRTQKQSYSRTQKQSISSIQQQQSISSTAAAEHGSYTHTHAHHAHNNLQQTQNEVRQSPFFFVGVAVFDPLETVRQGTQAVLVLSR